MFFYSERPGTLAAKKYKDDVPESIKKKRLNEIIQLQHKLSLQHNEQDLNKSFRILVEGKSKKSDAQWKGRNSQNKVIVFTPLTEVNPGDYVNVTVTRVNSATLIGQHLIP